MEGGAALAGQEGEAGVADLLFGALLFAAAQEGADAGDEDLVAEGLGDVVRGAHLQSQDDVVLLALSREHQHGGGGEVGVGLQPAENAQAVKAGQHPIEEDEVGLLGLGALEGLNAVLGFGGGVAGGGEVDGQEVADGGLVFDNQHEGVHRLLAPMLALWRTICPSSR